MEHQHSKLNHSKRSRILIWFTSKQLANLLDYKDESSVNRIFNRNKDEFTSGMTETVKLIEGNKFNELQSINIRIFSTRGAHLIGMLAKTKLVPKGKMLKKLMNACIPIIKTALKVGVKASINWVSLQDADHIHEDFCKAVQSSSNEISDTMIDNLLKSVSKTSSEMETLKQVLQEITRKKEIVFIIDAWPYFRG